ncbi:hypothetical protein GDO81_013124 [Engystomops pustulosus]|uniref:Large ribosomal subunit protein uL10m n=1 Tax=Engystomops pustulosus TaxID=76066 RepID=A0AAV7AY90_ENGPU|nr:hypothetical protein GDO81_013124 [Engystomops pustulosus]
MSLTSCHVIIWRTSSSLLSRVLSLLGNRRLPAGTASPCTSGRMAAALVRGAARELAWLPSLQCIRHRSKAVTRHKKAIHFERQKILALTKYIAPKPTISESCMKSKAKATDSGKENLLEKFLCSQLENVIQESKMLAVFQRNAIGADDFLHLKHRLHKHEIYIKVFPIQVSMVKENHLCVMQGLRSLIGGFKYLCLYTGDKKGPWPVPASGIVTVVYGAHFPSSEPTCQSKGNVAGNTERTTSTASWGLH